LNVIDELERLLSEATPGPWEVAHGTFKDRDTHIIAPDGTDEPWIIAEMGGYVISRGEFDEMMPNADLIAALRNAAPALLTEVRRLRVIEEKALALAKAANSGEWHKGEDCQVEGIAADCELCQAIGALEALRDPR
jgi:hypothetical protein